MAVTIFKKFWVFISKAMGLIIFGKANRGDDFLCYEEVLLIYKS